MPEFNENGNNVALLRLLDFLDFNFLMKRFSTLIAILLLFSSVGLCYAQDLSEDISEKNLSPLRKVYVGYRIIPDPYNPKETAFEIEMRPVVVYPNERFRNKNEEKFYWRTVRDVKRTLPYAKLINRTLQETYEYLETFDTKKEKDAYLKQFEKSLYAQYKPVMKKLTKSQGKMMIKLINRETNQTSYHIVKAFLGTFRAGFWQTFGRFFGVNLNAAYKPDKDKNDAVIERVATRVEQGLLWKKDWGRCKWSDLADYNRTCEIVLFFCAFYSVKKKI